ARPALEHDANAPLLAERDGVANLLLAVRADDRRYFLLEQRPHRLVQEIDLRQTSVATRAVVLRRLHEVVELRGQLSGVRRRRATATASATAAASATGATTRQIDDDASGALHGEILPRPSGSVDERRLTADRSTRRRGEHIGHAVHPRDAEYLT